MCIGVRLRWRDERRNERGCETGLCGGREGVKRVVVGDGDIGERRQRGCNGHTERITQERYMYYVLQWLNILTRNSVTLCMFKMDIFSIRMCVLSESVYTYNPHWLGPSS